MTAPPALLPEPCPICQRGCAAPSLAAVTPHHHLLLLYPCAVCGAVAVDPRDPGYAFRPVQWPLRVTLDRLPQALAVLAQGEW